MKMKAILTFVMAAAVSVVMAQAASTSATKTTTAGTASSGTTCSCCCKKSSCGKKDTPGGMQHNQVCLQQEGHFQRRCDGYDDQEVIRFFIKSGRELFIRETEQRLRPVCF